MAGAVYPCWKNEFTIGEAGGNSIPETVIANCLNRHSQENRRRYG